jgi:dihydroflavonol-4-reductase
MNKALVTGAAGFIGSNVVQELLDEGVGVRAMVLPGEDMRNLTGMDVEKVEGNVLDVESIDAALKGCDTLFHLAAIYCIWVPDRSCFFRVNLQGSRNVLWAAKRAGVEKIVYTSSIAGLGIAPGKQLSDETTEFNQWENPSDYVLTKHLSQQEALTFAREDGLPLVVVNPCFPYGEGDIAPTPTGKIMLDIANGSQFLTFEGGVNIVDVKDVARGHVLAAKHGEVGEMYILGNQNVTIQELMEMVARVAGLDMKFIKIPVPLAVLVGNLFEKIADATGVPPISTGKEMAYSAQHLFFDVSKAKEKLGYDPGPPEESIRRSIDWYRREGYLPQKGAYQAVMKAVGSLLKVLPLPG